jgi:hypothetical protein
MTMSKLIIIAWTALCIWNGWHAINNPTPAPPDDAIMIVFMTLVIWGVVVIPVSLIGLLFKRATPSSAVHSVARPRRIGLLEISLVAGFLVGVAWFFTRQYQGPIPQSRCTSADVSSGCY